jgi:hypothetical protein
MDWLRRLLLHNWWLKLLALGLAYALWALVIPTESGPVEIGISVPLELANVPANLEVVGEIPTRIHLHLRGSEARLRRLLPEEVGIALDLRQATAGNHVFRLTAADVEAPPGVEVMRIVPEEVRLEFVRR